MMIALGMLMYLLVVMPLFESFLNKRNLMVVMLAAMVSFSPWLIFVLYFIVTLLIYQTQRRKVHVECIKGKNVDDEIGSVARDTVTVDIAPLTAENKSSLDDKQVTEILVDSCYLDIAGRKVEAPDVFSKSVNCVLPISNCNEDTFLSFNLSSQSSLRSSSVANAD